MSSEALICKLGFSHKQRSPTNSQASTIIPNYGPRRLWVISDHRHKIRKQLLLSNRTSFTMDKTNSQMRKIERDLIMAAHVGPEPGPPVPPDPASNSWNFWVLGILVSAVLPFWTKFWPLLKLKREVESTLEVAEQAVEVVEEVAEEVEKVAGEVAEMLPEGGKLKGAVIFVENVGKETAREAQLAEDILEKVEQVEKDIDSLFGVGPNTDPSSGLTKEAKDQ